MAANLQRRGFAKLGKRFTQGNWIPTVQDSAPVSTFRRGAHCSVYDYDKNLDDQVRPAIVPDDVIQPQSDKYWAPHPQTGVFGPSEQEGRAAGGDHNSTSLPPPPNGSVLEQKAWFRPLEDTDKPQHV